MLSGTAADGALELELLEQKLGVRAHHSVAVINAPPESRLRLLTAGSLNPDQSDVVIGFATRPVDLAWLKPVYQAAHAGRTAWLIRPGIGGADTDLRRDWLVHALRQYCIAATREVPIDTVWSALGLLPIS